jgi:hypothetical protein
MDHRLDMIDQHL